MNSKLKNCPVDFYTAKIEIYYDIRATSQLAYRDLGANCNMGVLRTNGYYTVARLKADTPEDVQGHCQPKLEGNIECEESNLLKDNFIWKRIKSSIQSRDTGTGVRWAKANV